MDFVGSFFNFDKSVVPPSSRTLSRTPLLSRMNSQVTIETTVSNAQISLLRQRSSDDPDQNQSAL